MERLTVTVTEAAEILGLSRTSAYELVWAGALPSVRLGRRIVISRRVLEDLVGAALPVEPPTFSGGLRNPSSGERRVALAGSRSRCSRAHQG
jgi:excisionase family DNA binding protein